MTTQQYKHQHFMSVVTNKMQPENLKNLLPALGETPRSQMSSKEFQRLLYTWFEEKGLVADLRSYLRVLMINELRNTTVGKIESRSNFSLSKQAFSLVIAEHLLREKYHYTLSVFSTEVPTVANQLPFSLFEAHTHNETWRFDQESVISVLELIGISKGSGESLRITASYFRNGDSLLTCLVNSKVAAVEELPLENDGDYLQNVLKVLRVPPSMIEIITRKVEEHLARQIPIERRQFEELQDLLVERNNQLKVLVDEQMSQRRDNKKLKDELKETLKRLKHSQAKEQTLNLKESEIRRKLDEVTMLQRSLEKTISKEKSEVCSLKHCTDSCQSLVAVNEELRKRIGKLEDENKAKSVEIDHLSTKITSLVKDLQNSKQNIEFLNTCLMRSSQINLHQEEERVSSSEDTSENLTGEILQQVRSKLQQLERESEALDEKFMRLKKNDFVTK